MARYAARPRAPSPPLLGHSEDEDDSSDSGASSSSGSSSETGGVSYTLDSSDNNTYSVVQDSVMVIPPPPPPKTKLFGDSVNPSPAESTMSSSSSSSGGRGGAAAAASLASLYQAKRGVGGGMATAAAAAGSGKYDAITVEEIKAQFQKQIETMIQSQERNTVKSAAPVVVNTNNLTTTAPATTSSSSPVRKSHIPSSSERELNGIRDLNRGKSFLEARTAVQKQIERMFHESTNASAQPKEIKHTMHGVSHAIPGQDDENIQPPPPIHYGGQSGTQGR